jgi:5-amino-6-(5-phosphoribosylamino)uracil reductase/diaminohydroxyphosphoribosylaminopyrimidine deaminase/5-amino-6-(5-phosphoribosylamino)uracil reductase
MLLAALAERDIGSLMVEGGAALITSLLRARLVDRLTVCIAPLVLGTGIEGVGELGIDALGDALRLHDVTVERYGADIVVDGWLEQENPHAAG